MAAVAEPVRFRKKPVEVEAIRYDGTNHADVQAFAPECFQAVDPRDCGDDPDIHAQVWDRLHSTWVGVKPGMWIVRGVVGEFYPIDEGVLADTYEGIGDD